MISIIVPIYNVELYIVRCLESLVNLTAVENNDIEIILIDDGSTDKSGKIAEDYASRYSNIYLYHTENRGLSAARNHGIDKSHGEWIMFVDSDDWVDPNFVNVPFEIARRSDSDLVIFNYYKVSRVLKCASPKHRKGIISLHDAIEYGDAFAWNKLYKRVLFDGIRYPEGHLYEDVLTTHKLIYKANRICMINDRLIHYCIRSDSIAQTYTVSNINAWYDSHTQRCEFLKNHDYPEEKILSLYQSVSLRYCIRMNPSSDERYLQAKHFLDTAKYVPKSLSVLMKMMFILWRINKPMFHAVCKIFGKRIKQ